MALVFLLFLLLAHERLEIAGWAFEASTYRKTNTMQERIHTYSRQYHEAGKIAIYVKRTIEWPSYCSGVIDNTCCKAVMNICRNFDTNRLQPPLASSARRRHHRYPCPLDHPGQHPLHSPKVRRPQLLSRP